MLTLQWIDSHAKRHQTGAIKHMRVLYESPNGAQKGEIR